jgi:hypothetical protein
MLHESHARIAKTCSQAGLLRTSPNLEPTLSVREGFCGEVSRIDQTHGTRDCPTQAMLEPMPYKLKPWQWTLVGVAFCIYCVLATFGIYGGFYLGFPPYTPAFLNHTRQNITQTITLERKTLLRLVGNVREGRVEVKLNGKSIAVLLGQVNQTVLLEAGKYELLLENQQSTGDISYKLE